MLSDFVDNEQENANMIVLFANLLKFVFATYLNCHEKYTNSVAEKKILEAHRFSNTELESVCVCVFACAYVGNFYSR